MIPRQLFLTKGSGKHREKMLSLELALREAGIAQYNLVKVTSIFPPGCTIIPRKEGLTRLSPGEIVFCVMAENSTNEPNRLIAASIGLAAPKEKDRYGYLLEHQSFDQNGQEAGNYAESLAVEMLATTYKGVGWYKHKNHLDEIATTTNIAQTAVSEEGGLWTTAVAVAVFVPEEN
jgi:arginine decarboxylase